MNKIGLVLSGGGVRGFAHLGFLKVLDELRIRPAVISGVSSGAIFGALYSYGYSPDQILSLAKKNSYFGVSNFLWRKEGLFSMEPIRKILLDLIPENSFDALKIPLYINATDILHNKTIYFSSGELIDPIVASASFPVLFQAVPIENSKFVDGGLLDNFPIEPLVDHCDKIIGSHVNRLGSIGEKNIKFSKTQMIERCFQLAIANSVYSKVNKCDVFVEPALNGFGLFKMRNMERIFEIGYHAALEQKQNIERLLEI